MSRENKTKSQVGTRLEFVTPFGREKFDLEYCRCSHPNTLHAGLVGPCSALHDDRSTCSCVAFKEAI